ncbi:MAG: pyridoxal-phosphate dependent enzyme [Phycisphaerales bacterium]
MPAPTLLEIQEAAARIAPHARRTPLVESAALGARAGRAVHCKCETMQRTGSFKFRGACNAVWRVPAADAARGVVTHSSGNHALALAEAARERGIPAHVVMPARASAVKRAAVLAAGATLYECGETAAEREERCAQVLAQTRGTLVPPYDHAWTIAGQGTIALEILESLPQAGTIVVPVGGGGLISGIAIAAKALRPGIRIVGAEPALADDAAEGKRTGVRAAQRPPVTIADGLRAPLGELTFPVVRELVDEIVTVSEEAIVEGLRTLFEEAKLVAEPSAAVGVAALLDPRMRARAAEDAARGPTVVVLCGGNVDLASLPFLRA